MAVIVGPVESLSGLPGVTAYSSCDMAILYASAVQKEPDEPTLSELVARALAGDQKAWLEIVARVKNVAWRQINGFRFGRSDAEDVFAATLFRLVENLDRIREPEKLLGWVATTARHEGIAMARSRQRLVPTEDMTDYGIVEVLDFDRGLVLDEDQAAVRSAFVQLDQRCQQLLRLLSLQPPVRYREIGQIMGMPHGAIGPNRRRCLDKLRALSPLSEYLEEP